MARPDWALAFEDEVWWSRFAHPALRAWAAPDRPLRLVEQAVAKDDPDPKALACYGLLVRWWDRGTDAPPHEEAWLRFVDGRPVSAVTTRFLAWSCAQQLRAAYRHPDPAQGKKIAERVVTSFPNCPVPEIARLGRTLKQWRQAFLAYFTTNRSSNGGTEAINGLIELHRRVARGFRNRDNYRLRMLLIGGGLTSPHLK